MKLLIRKQGDNLIKNLDLDISINEMQSRDIE